MLNSWETEGLFFLEKKGEVSKGNREWGFNVIHTTNRREEKFIWKLYCLIVE